MAYARERDVVAQIALGYSNVEAADRLGLRPEAAKAYLRSASQKLGTKGSLPDSPGRPRLEPDRLVRQITNP